MCACVCECVCARARVCVRACARVMGNFVAAIVRLFSFVLFFLVCVHVGGDWGKCFESRSSSGIRQTSNLRLLMDGARKLFQTSLP